MSLIIKELSVNERIQYFHFIQILTTAKYPLLQIVIFSFGNRAVGQPLKRKWTGLIDKSGKFQLV